MDGQFPLCLFHLTQTSRRPYFGVYVVMLSPSKALRIELKVNAPRPTNLRKKNSRSTGFPGAGSKGNE